MYKNYFRMFIIYLLFANVLFIYDVMGQEKVFKAGIGDDGIQRVDILGGKYYFDPDYIIVKNNVLVELKITKERSIVPHNIIMNEPDAGIVFNKSLSTKPKVIKFTPKRVGKFPFYCDKKLLFFKSHREKGMKGILEVVK